MWKFLSIYFQKGLDTMVSFRKVIEFLDVYCWCFTNDSKDCKNKSKNIPKYHTISQGHVFNAWEIVLRVKSNWSISLELTTGMIIRRYQLIEILCLCIVLRSVYGIILMRNKTHSCKHTVSNSKQRQSSCSQTLNLSFTYLCERNSSCM